jgi:hypothetical protein
MYIVPKPLIVVSPTDQYTGPQQWRSVAIPQSCVAGGGFVIYRIQFFRRLQTL